MPAPPARITFVDASARPGLTKVERRVRRGIYKGRTLCLLRRDRIGFHKTARPQRARGTVHRVDRTAPPT